MEQHMSTKSIARAEAFKIRSHRTPMVTAAVMFLAVLAPAAVLMFYTPSGPSAYSDAWSATYGLIGPLVAIVFGGWLLGTEYRQGTTKRMLTTEPRRMRALATKGAVGAGVLSVLLAATALTGWGAAWIVGNMNDISIAWNGRELLASGLFALAAGAVSFALSAITRSDSFAMVGSVALVLVLDPLLSLIPKIGDYTFVTAVSTLTDKVAGSVNVFAGPASLTVTSAVITTGAWFAAFIGGAAYLFSTRDV